MKTTRNPFSKISKATFIITLVLTSLVTVSSQNIAQQPFFYFRTDFIIQTVYPTSNEYVIMTADFPAFRQGNIYDAIPVPVKYTISTRHTNFDSDAYLNGMSDFLTRAAQLNVSIARVEDEKDNTLDLLTQAATLNMPVTKMETVEENTLDFLTAAAQLYAPVAQDNNSSDDTLDFLINAAQLNAPVCNEENSQDGDLLDFLIQAAHLNDCVAE